MPTNPQQAHRRKVRHHNRMRLQDQKLRASPDKKPNKNTQFEFCTVGSTTFLEIFFYMIAAVTFIEEGKKKSTT
jgi:hypothetical protein